MKGIQEFYDMKKEEFQKLWIRYLEKKASEEEVISLLSFIREGRADDFLQEFITGLNPDSYRKVDLSEQDWQNMWLRINDQTQPVESKISYLGEKRNHRIIPLWVRYTGYVAAAVIIIAFGFRNLFNDVPASKLPEQVKVEVKKADVEAPNSVHAILTLADGSKIIIDSIQHGEVARQGNANIIKREDGQLIYNTGISGNTEVKYNTLTVPRGSKIIELILADGTTVVLNAASSLTYPTSFVGKERKVEMTGEGYFEVARNTSMPFIVQKGDARVEVLGTHFNINAYDDEDMINVTLLEGSVKVSRQSSNDNLVLKPGQMARINDEMQLLPKVDLEEVMAWKVGKFKFGEYANIGTVMRQISRWYDVAVEYRGEVEGHIGGSISREVNVSQVLNLLEMTGVVKFGYDGRKIIVMTNNSKVKS